MLWQRLISSLVGIPLLIAVVWQGGMLLFAVTAVLMFMALWEISQMFAQINLRVPMVLALPGCLILLITAYQYHEGFISGAVVTVLLFYLLAMVLFYPRFTPQDVAVTLTGTFYVGLFVYLFLIGTLDQGKAWLILLLVCTWTSDTMAYFVGRQWGQRRVAPKLSPGKTMEGALGGIIGSVVAVLIVAFFYSFIPLWSALILGTLIGLATLVGDLVESALKRQAGVKDSGSLIPGHGGVLDRFDSLLFTAPLVYHFVGLIKIS